MSNTPTNSNNENNENETPEYVIDLQPTNSSASKSVKSMSVDGNPYAGDWPREKAFEQQADRENPDLWLGYHDSAHRREVCIPYGSQFRHSAIFGGTGAGKTTLINNQLSQHAYAGHGFMFIDPKGEDTEDLLQQIPDERLDDIIWVDPAREDSKIVGINFLDVKHNGNDVEFQAEMSNVVDDVVGILSSQDGGFARMKGIWRNLVRGMILLNQNREDEENYTLEDLYDLLRDKLALMDFAEKVERIDEDISQFTHEISQMDAEVLEPASRRLQPWVENKITKEIIAHEKSTVNIKEAVESDKIILVRLKDVNDGAKRIISTALTRRMWSAIQAREKNETGDYNPYFLFIDELHNVATEDSSLVEMLALARGYKLSVNVATQFPSQLSQNLQDSIYGQCENMLAMRVMLPRDAGTIAQRFSDLHAEAFTNFGQFKIWTQLMIDGETQDPFVTETFAPYPPLRTMGDVQDVISDSLDKYGTERTETATDIRYQPTTTTDGPSSEDLDADTVISCVASCQYQQHGHLYKPVATHLVKDMLTHYVEDETHAELISNKFEMMNMDSVDVRRESGEMVVSLTQTGKNTLFNESGSASQAGKDTHRMHLLPGAVRALTEVGYLAHPVVQTGGTELPDGIANLPITRDINSNKGFAEIKRQREAYQEDLANIHPRLPTISDGKNVHIEAETNPASKGARALTNLVKAVEKENMCMFVVKDGTSDIGRVEGYADKLSRVLKDPPLVTDIDDLNRKYFYRDDYMKVIADGGTEMTVVMPADIGTTKWREMHADLEGVELVDMDTNETIIEFDNLTELDLASKHSVPAYYQYDQSAKKYRVYQPREDGGVDQTTYDSKEAFQSSWQKVTGPFVPDNEFSRPPTDDDWSIMIIPDDDNEKYTVPLAYNVDSVENGDVTGDLVEFTSGDSFDSPDNPFDAEPEDEQDEPTLDDDTDDTPSAEVPDNTDTDDGDDDEEDSDEQQNLSGFFS